MRQEHLSSSKCVDFGSKSTPIKDDLYGPWTLVSNRKKKEKSKPKSPPVADHLGIPEPTISKHSRVHLDNFINIKSANFSSKYTLKVKLEHENVLNGANSHHGIVGMQEDVY